MRRSAVAVLFVIVFFGASVARAIEFDDVKPPAQGPKHDMLWDFGYGMGNGVITPIRVPVYLWKEGFQDGLKYLVSNHSVSYWIGYCVGLCILVGGAGGSHKAVTNSGDNSKSLKSLK